jgi:hypothetical protein
VPDRRVHLKTESACNNVTRAPSPATTRQSGFRVPSGSVFGARPFFRLRPLGIFEFQNRAKGLCPVFSVCAVSALDPEFPVGEHVAFCRWSIIRCRDGIRLFVDTCFQLKSYPKRIP